jgi:hypothetical protein
MKLGIFSTDFRKKSLNIKYNQICPVGVELLHEDRQRHDKANSRILQFCKHT